MGKLVEADCILFDPLGKCRKAFLNRNLLIPLSSSGSDYPNLRLFHIGNSFIVRT